MKIYHYLGKSIHTIATQNKVYEGRLMSFKLILATLLSLIVFSSCSGDITKKEKQNTSENIEKKPSISSTNSITSKELEPGVHLSGTQNIHISGSTQATNHVSGR
jgi:hypothetical protein